MSGRIRAGLPTLLGLLPPLLSLLLACAGAGGPRPETRASSGVIRSFGAHEFEPTPMHETVYRMMERCTGREGDLEGLTWKVALWVDSPDRDRALKAGWHRDGEQREVVFYEEYVFDGETVSHEILHDLYDGEVPLDVAERCILDGERLLEEGGPEGPGT